MSHPVRRPSVGIETLSIRDFRGIDKLDLDFRGPDGHPNSLVVLAGPNGCGKTTVLEAALILVGGHELIAGRRGRPAIRRGARDYDIRANIRAHDVIRMGYDAAHLYDPDPHPVPHRYFPSSRAPSFVGHVAPSVGRTESRPSIEGRNPLLEIKQLLVNAATIERFGSAPPQFVSYSAVIREINNAWREFYPESGQSFTVEIVPADESKIGGFDVYLISPDATRVEIDLLSSGQLELFLFLSTLALNQDREGILFIDEPELHLDPQWHRPILRSLVRLQPRAQLVVATHSPEIYDAAASYERHYLVPEDDPRSWLWAVHNRVGSGA